MSSRKKRIAAACAAALITTPALSDGAWTIGFGLGVDTEIYRDSDTEASGFPFVAYDTARFRIGFDGLAYKAVNTQSFGLRLHLSPRGAPDFPDTALFDGLDRDTAFEAGVSARRAFAGDLYARAALLHDVSSAHEGYEAQVDLGKTFPAGPVIVDMSLGLRYRDDNLNAYLVGVSAAEATSARPAYAPGSTLTPVAQVSVTLPLSGKSTVVGTLSYEQLGDAYDDSPLTSDGSVASAGVAIIYQF